ncbi:hypothetical protein NL676_002861 [Syzygium grande]|nr:hypothetical protein NL676_002861 [Syzygium grande]
MTRVIGKRWLSSVINNLQKQKLCWSVLVRTRQSLASATDGDDLRQNNMDVETPSRSQHRHWKRVTDGQSDWNFVSSISSSGALNAYACGRSKQV